jgi:hypothetical protein
MSGRARSSARSLALVKSARWRLLCCGRHTVNLFRYSGSRSLRVRVRGGGRPTVSCHGPLGASDAQLRECPGEETWQSLGSSHLLGWASARHCRSPGPRARRSWRPPPRLQLAAAGDSESDPARGHHQAQWHMWEAHNGAPGGSRTPPGAPLRVPGAHDQFCLTRMRTGTESPQINGPCRGA